MPPPNVLMLGTGEYTTGFASGGAAKSDKSTGVVALVMLDLRRRGKVAKIGMCGTNGAKLPAIRAHMQQALGDVYAGIDPTVITTWPADDVVDPEAYHAAIAAYAPGDVAIIFTPDDTHFAIASACLAAGMHVLITKPPVKTLDEHNALAAKAAASGVLCAIEVHKRYDPIYVDARDRAASLGDFSYFTAFMSQPRHQLETFRSWAGLSSDISYYLNSHHVDFHEWLLRGRARAETVTALASDGVAARQLGRPCEDTITLAVRWRNARKEEEGAAAEEEEATGPPAKRAKSGGDGGGPVFTGAAGHATYTSSWVAPKSDVHSQQRFFYMGHSGEVNVDQAHRGYSAATDETGYGSVNPLFWKPAPSNGKFAGQRTYGYLSFEKFVAAAAACNAGAAAPEAFDEELATVHTTLGGTAVLEAGRLSLDHGGRPVDILYENADRPDEPTGLALMELVARGKAW